MPSCRFIWKMTEEQWRQYTADTNSSSRTKKFNKSTYYGSVYVGPLCFDFFYGRKKELFNDAFINPDRYLLSTPVEFLSVINDTSYMEASRIQPTDNPDYFSHRLGNDLDSGVLCMSFKDFKERIETKISNYITNERIAYRFGQSMADGASWENLLHLTTEDVGGEYVYSKVASCLKSVREAAGKPGHTVIYDDAGIRVGTYVNSGSGDKPVSTARVSGIDPDEIYEIFAAGNNAAHSNNIYIPVNGATATISCDDNWTISAFSNNAYTSTSNG